MKKLIIVFVLLIPLFYIGYQQLGSKVSVAEEEFVEPDLGVHVLIEPGDTFGIITEKLGIPFETVRAILATSTPIYDLTTIRADKELIFYFNEETKELERIVYEPTTEEIVSIATVNNSWQAEKTPINYEVRERRVSGTIVSSLYQAALDQDLDTRAIIDLAETFAWQIDFAIDIRTGDTFDMIYEERYRDGEYIMPGKIIAAQVVNDGTPFTGYYFEDDETDGYYDPDGKSLQKIFLKSPLQYRYISSGFGKRIDPISRKPSTHTGIDYAAPYGTPAVAVGDGTVISSGWNGGYGYAVDVRHNETYTTRYGHFSRLAVKYGQKVVQGQIVGYVGSTGWSTGPHLHYEMHKFGSQVNPFTVDIPSGKAVAEENLPAYLEHIKQFNL